MKSKFERSEIKKIEDIKLYTPYMFVKSMAFVSIGCSYYASRTEPRSGKTSLRGFRSGPTQTGLYSHRK